MSIGQIIKREVQVATSPRAQPVWFRVLKWVVIVTLVVRYWGQTYFWWGLAAAFAFSLALHFTWRWKTHGWTRPWGGWNDVEPPR
jgi:hypothetical protein